MCGGVHFLFGGGEEVEYHGQQSCGQLVLSIEKEIVSVVCLNLTVTLHRIHFFCLLLKEISPSLWDYLRRYFLFNVTLSVSL